MVPRKKLYVFILICLHMTVLLLGIELTSRFLVNSFDHLYTRNIVKTYERYLFQREEKIDSKSTKTVQARKLHPYFGHVLTYGNNYGFLSPYDYPYKKKKDEFVVGILGGSTAMHWARWLHETRAWEYSNLFLKNNIKRVVILNMAISGMHQPQQLAVASKFSDSLDMVISLDGWNEVTVDKCPYLPPDFPQQYSLLYRRETEPEIYYSIRNQAKTFRGLTDKIYHSYFKKSYFVYLLWSLKKNRLNRDIQLAANQQNNKDENSGRFHLECSDDGKISFDHWKKYSDQLETITRMYNIPFIHILQPNPYLPHVKMLNREERRITQWEDLNWKVHNSIGELALEFYNKYTKKSLSIVLMQLIFLKKRSALYTETITLISMLWEMHS